MKDANKLIIAELVMQGKTLSEIQESYPSADREAVCSACLFAEANMGCKPLFAGYGDPSATPNGIPICIGVRDASKLNFKPGIWTKCSAK